MSCLRRSPLTVAALALLAAAPLSAQTRDSSDAAVPARLALDFSGTIFGYYGLQPATTPAQQPNQADNAFLVERAYLTFRVPVSDRASVRVTTDVYQTTEATPNAYAVRAKYAYLQYAGARHRSGISFTGRAGILQNVLLESQERFWTRYLSQAPTEKAAYFSSADVGVAALATLPNRAGEVYATIVNGPGYTARERDRFKDYAVRVTLTPLAGDSTRPALLRGLTLTAWGYKGAVASEYVNGGAGQAGSVGAALDRSRAGIFLAAREPRLTVAAEYAQRRDGQEEGGNTPLSPRTAGATTGRLWSAWTLVRPLAFVNASHRSAFGVVARYDHLAPTAESEGLAAAPNGANRYHNLIAGVTWDLAPRAQLALDYQETLAASNGASASPPNQMKGYFAHFTVSF